MRRRRANRYKDKKIFRSVANKTKAMNQVVTYRGGISLQANINIKEREVFLMNFDVYAIKDLEKGEFALPFFVPEGTGVESVKINFKRLIEKGDSELSYFPERFELWQLAIFDSSHTHRGRGP